MISINRYFLTTIVAAIFLLPILVKAEPVDEIVVSARLNPKPLSRINSSVSILTSDELSRRGQLFLMDALRFVPALSITQEGGVGTLAAVRIRGGESNHTKVFIDGVEANSTSGGGFDFSSLLASQIERVEIVRGANSLVNGAGAVGGVIYITTKESGGANIQVSSGSFGTFNIAGNLGGNVGGFSMNIGGQLYRTRGNDISTIDTITTDEDRRYDEFSDDKEGYFNAAFNAKIKYQKIIGLHQLNTKFNYSYTRYELEGDQELDTNPDPAIYSPVFLDTGQFTKNYNHRLGFLISDEISLAPNLEVSTSISSQYFKGLMEHNTRPETLLDPTDLSSRVMYEYVRSVSKEERIASDVKIGGFYGNNLFKAGLALIGGWEVEKYEQTEENSENKTYIGGEVSASSYGLDIVAGARGQFYAHSKNALVWQLSAGYQPPDQEFVRLRGSYGISINEPDLIELYGYFPASFTPNPNLAPETVTSWDAGLDFDLSYMLASPLKFSASYFSLNIEDEISGFLTPINNDGTSKRKGVEFEAQLLLDRIGIIDGIDFITSYTYTDAKMADGSKSLNRPKHIVNFTMRNQIQNLSFDWDLSWQSQQFAYNGKIGSYLLINVQLGFDVNDNLNFFVRGDNLTGEKTANTVGYERRGRGVYFGIKGKI